MSTIIACGRLGKDAELRTTTSGTKIAAFSVADDIGYGDKKRTQWLKCSLFGERAEKIVSYLTKGLMVEVIGVPQAEAWIKDDKAHGTIAITVSDVKFHGSAKGSSNIVYTNADGGPRTLTADEAADVRSFAKGTRNDMNDDVPW